MLFLKLAFANVIRNRRSGLSIAIGIFLSLILFNALNFNLVLVQDEIISSMVFSPYEILGYSYYYEGDSSKLLNDTATWDEISAEAEIQSVNPIASSYAYGSDSNLDYSFYGVREDDWEKILTTVNPDVIEGSLNFTIYDGSNIPVIGFATTPKIENETLAIVSYDRFNITLDILGWTYFDTTETFFSTKFDLELIQRPNSFVFITLFPYMIKFNFFDLELLIKLESNVIDYQDVVGTVSRIDKLVTRLNLKYGTDYWFYSPVSGQLAGAQFAIYVFLVVSLIFLLPFFFLSFYLSKLSSDLNLESRRIQYSIFLTRGVHPKTIQRSYLAEGVILGLINGIITFLLTPGVGLFFGGFLPVNIPSLPVLDLWINYYVQNSAQLFWSIGIGMALGFMIMRIPRYYLFLSPHELMHKYRIEEGETVKVRGRKDLAILMIGLYPVGMGILLVLSIILQAPTIFYFVLVLLGSYSLYVIPFSPFLISYGLSSILARQRWLLLAISRIFTKPFPALRPLVERLVFSKLYRISRIAFVMALALTFIIFPLILAASFEAYNENLANFTLGGDIRIDVTMNSSISLEILKQRTEVKEVALIQRSYEKSFTKVHLNPSEYLKSVEVRPFWRLDQEKLANLSATSVFVSNMVLKDFSVKIGDCLTFNDTEYTIVGSFIALGGTDIITGSTYVAVFNNQLNPQFNSGSFVLKMDKLSVTSVRTLYDFITELDSSANFKSKIDFKDPSDQPESFDIFLFLIRILETQALLLSFISIFTLAFLMVIRVRERTQELGIWRSKGMSDRQLIEGMVIETASIGTLGILVGLLTGTLLIVGFQGFILNTIVEGVSLIPLELVIPIEMWILFFLMTLGVIIIALIIGLWVTLTPISEQIRYEDYT
ncbi:MAG: ABC transporter permease [Candidatus Heimdallarchaeota archaeon]|nr:ABC transporter permease [Candidatus Heimdallarchaeota archaeon]